MLVPSLSWTAWFLDTCFQLVSDLSCNTYETGGNKQTKQKKPKTHNHTAPCHPSHRGLPYGKPLFSLFYSWKTVKSPVYLRKLHWIPISDKILILSESITISSWLKLSSQFLFFLFGCMACGISVPWPGIEPMPPAVEAQSPNQGSPGKSLKPSF